MCRKIIACLLFTITSFTILEAFSCHTSGLNAKTMFPTGRVQLNHDGFNEQFAAAFLGEIGPNNGRANGTIGIEIDPNNYLKVGAEYLNQKLRYQFHHGKTSQWMYQWAVGGKYKAVIDHCFFKGILFDAFASNAPSKSLKTRQYTTTSDIETLKRRIAGSHAWGVEGGILFNPWKGASMSILADYDNLKYNRRYCSSKNVKGLGCTATLKQMVFENINLNLLAEFRRPYNNYSAELLYCRPQRCGTLTGGLFGSYMQGKAGLSNVAVAGVQIGFSFGGTSNTCYQSSYCDSRCTHSDLSAWMLEPAVYIPVVMTINEQQLTKRCIGPQASVPAPAIITLADNTLSFDASPYFTGDNLTWSVVSSNPSVASATINASGLVSITIPISQDATINYTVTATNTCGSAVSIFQIVYVTE